MLLDTAPTTAVLTEPPRHADRKNRDPTPCLRLCAEPWRLRRAMPPATDALSERSGPSGVDPSRTRGGVVIVSGVAASHQNGRAAGPEDVAASNQDELSHATTRDGCLSGKAAA